MQGNNRECGEVARVRQQTDVLGAKVQALGRRKAEYWLPYSEGARRGGPCRNKNAGLVCPAFSLSFIRRKRLVPSFPRIYKLSVTARRFTSRRSCLHHQREVLEFLLKNRKSATRHLDASNRI